jgi:ElaB/YqjD/DUF883 family membrane-anchored ribosome-binding protein
MNSDFEKRGSLTAQDNWGQGAGYGNEKPGSGFDQVRSTLSEKLRTAAGRVREKGETAGSEDMRGFGSQASDWLERSAKYVDDFDAQRFKEDMSTQVRQNPGRSLLIAGAAGLILGRR